MDLEELKNYLVDEAEYDSEDVNMMSNYELLDAYLVYNGIIGYTDDILNTVAAVLNIDDDKLMEVYRHG